MKRDQRELVSFLLHLRTDVPMVYLNRKQSVSTRLEFVIESSYAGITSKGGYFL